MKPLRDIAVSIAGESCDSTHRRLRSLVASGGILPTVEGHAPTGSQFDAHEAARAALGVRLLELGVPSLETAYVLLATRDDNWGEVVADPWMWTLDVLHVRNSNGIVEAVADLRPLGTRAGFELPGFLAGLHDDPEVLGVLSVDLTKVFPVAG